MVQFKNGTELGAPGDEYIKSPWREGSPRVLKELTRRPTSHFPPRGLFILVTRRPELSAIFELDHASCDLNGFGPPF